MRLQPLFPSDLLRLLQRQMFPSQTGLTSWHQYWPTGDLPLIKDTNRLQTSCTPSADIYVPEDICGAEQSLCYQHRVPRVPALSGQVRRARVLRQLLLNLRGKMLERLVVRTSEPEPISVREVTLRKD